MTRSRSSEIQIPHFTLSPSSPSRACVSTDRAEPPVTDTLHILRIPSVKDQDENPAAILLRIAQKMFICGAPPEVKHSLADTRSSCAPPVSVMVEHDLRRFYNVLSFVVNCIE